MREKSSGLSKHNNKFRPLHCSALDGRWSWFVKFVSSLLENRYVFQKIWNRVQSAARQSFKQNFGDENATGASPTAYKEIFIPSTRRTRVKLVLLLMMFYYFIDRLVTQQSGQIMCYVPHITLFLRLIPHMKISLPNYWPLLITSVHSWQNVFPHDKINS